MNDVDPCPGMTPPRNDFCFVYINLIHNVCLYLLDLQTVSQLAQVPEERDEVLAYGIGRANQRLDDAVVSVGEIRTRA